MKFLFINTVCGIKSTGRLVTESAEQLIQQGHECMIAYGRENVPEKYKKISYRISSDSDVRINALKARLFDNEGFNAKAQTKKFIEWANNYNPDVLWLHNLHGYYINIEILFNWIKTRPNMKVLWTLHDCWPFTGHCTHFSFVNCDLWKKNCSSCIQSKEYPKSTFIKNSAENFKRKKATFCGVGNMTLITPSAWLADLVKQSFLNEYKVEIRHNSVDNAVFKPTPGNFRIKHNLTNKKIILGVATSWGEKKGLNDFIELSKRLDNDYKVVLVGIDKKIKRMVPDNILSLPVTESTRELAQTYSAADVFLNLSKEESFGLTTLEALSCGTYPIVYKETACEEVVKKYGGISVDQNIQSVIEAVNNVMNHRCDAE